MRKGVAWRHSSRDETTAPARKRADGKVPLYTFLKRSSVAAGHTCLVTKLDNYHPNAIKRLNVGMIRFPTVLRLLFFFSFLCLWKTSAALTALRTTFEAKHNNRGTGSPWYIKNLWNKKQTKEKSCEFFSLPCSPDSGASFYASVSLHCYGKQCAITRGGI